MPWVTIEPTEFIAVLERTGESEVIAALDRDDEWITHDGRKRVAEGWLRSKESARRDAREAMTLSIAQDANDIASKARSDARFANKIAIAAIIFTAATAIIVAVIQVIWLP